MFHVLGRLIFAWGAGQGGTPPPPASEGPFWVSHYHMISPRCYSMVVREIQVIPGRIWSDDPSLAVFMWDNEA